MGIDRKKLYKFPWSKTDNPGGWVEVTDECDLDCPGCYRHKIEGHRPLEEVKKDILACQELTNCSRMAISGGEPLLYPHLIEVVDFISNRNMKPIILTNGEKLTPGFGAELKKAGLAQILFHVDSGQNRPGWAGKNELEMNELRQHFADLVYDLGKVQCGYNITVFHSTLKHVPGIVEWGRANIHKVQHLSLITARALPTAEKLVYTVKGKKIDTDIFQSRASNLTEINITTDEIYEMLQGHFPTLRACAYLNGTTAPETYKFLIILNIGSRKRIYGTAGAKTVELAQVFHYLFKGKYSPFPGKPKVGKKLFLLSLFDRQVGKALLHFLKASMKNPLRLFDRIYIQCINLQQPNEIYNGEVNLCDGCMNMMVYKGELIHSCKLDEYRLFGGLFEPQQSAKLNKNYKQEIGGV